MLKDRVTTTLILIPLLVAAVFLLTTKILAYVFGAFLLIGAWEWSRLSGLRSIIFRGGYVGTFLLLMVSGYELIFQRQLLQTLMLGVSVYWLLVFLWLVILPVDKILSNVTSSVYLKGVVGFILLIPVWLSLLALHASGANGVYILLSLFILIWVADSGAYFVGRLIGLTKLAPAISPGKTLEGVYGALVTGAMTAFIIGHLLNYSVYSLLSYISLSLLCIVFSIVGDLFESVIKRSARVKDSGSIFPGHGGVMDRIDRLTAAAPLYFLGFSWFPSLLR